MKAMAVACAEHPAVGGHLEHVCHLCRRKFPDALALVRHEQLSDLHRRNLEQQDGLVQQHKQEVAGRVHVLRQQLHDVVAAGVEPPVRAALEGQLRRRLGELAQAQEALEQSRCLQGTSRSPKSREARAGRLALDLGVACWQGGKEVQEDRHVLDIELRSPEGHAVVGFCVLDGHCGGRCVEHLAERLPAQLQARLAAQPSLSEEHLRRAVAEACALADGEFLARARQQEMMDGSTMLLGLLFPDPEGAARGRPAGSCRLLVANVGDSRAVLCRAATGSKAGQLEASRLSDDHKPNRPDEQRRIEARGGVVDFYGVMRVFLPTQVSFGGRVIPRWGLAVSRSFGDLLLKEPERYGCVQVAPGGLVTAEPEQQVIDIEPATDRFVILASDGVWDVLRDEDAAAVCASQAGAELAAYSLVRHAFAAGSGDNLTALVVAWRPTD